VGLLDQGETLEQGAVKGGGLQGPQKKLFGRAGREGNPVIRVGEDQVWTTEDEVKMLQELVYGRPSPFSPFLKNTAVSAGACSVCSHALLPYCQEVLPNNFPN